MIESKLSLANPPIVEMVLDFECDLAPGQTLAALEGPARQRFEDSYPSFQTQFVQEYKFESSPQLPPNSSIQHRIAAWQFWDVSGKQLLQVRDQGFSFNRLAPYTSLDDYLPEVERVWRLYVDLALPTQIRLIRLRYINRILLPAETNRVELDDYFAVGPRLPDEKKLEFVGFLNQHAAIEIETGHQINIVLTGQAREGNNLPVIFDNCVTSTERGEPDNWPWILAKIQALRNLKNYIFEKTLTKACLNLFQKE